ncbi:unnamed protein product [Cylicocyclus nassatus]|uniref:Secreted protein n=1 Tax=Cylicocyclus nassatus TaxID=53992 RepID=A0AA36H0J3_CYLNA|nr:unnamed protein product [Cylicocyclus nassatus]
MNFLFFFFFLGACFLGLTNAIGLLERVRKMQEKPSFKECVKKCNNDKMQVLSKQHTSYKFVPIAGREGTICTNPRARTTFQLRSKTRTPPSKVGVIRCFDHSQVDLSSAVPFNRMSKSYPLR